MALRASCVASVAACACACAAAAAGERDEERVVGPTDPTGVMLMADTTPGVLAVAESGAEGPPEGEASELRTSELRRVGRG